MNENRFKKRTWKDSSITFSIPPWRLLFAAGRAEVRTARKKARARAERLTRYILNCLMKRVIWIKEWKGL